MHASSEKMYHKGESEDGDSIPGITTTGGVEREPSSPQLVSVPLAEYPPKFVL